MSEHQKHSAFLKAMLTCDNNAEHQVLQERIVRAERDEICLSYACRLVGLIALLALAGLGYCAVLLPEFFHKTRHFYIQLFSALALGSVLCFTVFAGLWWWYRAIVNRLHDECRKFIAALVQSHAHPGSAPTIYREETGPLLSPNRIEALAIKSDSFPRRRAS